MSVLVFEFWRYIEFGNGSVICKEVCIIWWKFFENVSFAWYELWKTLRLGSNFPKVLVFITGVNSLFTLI